MPPHILIHRDCARGEVRAYPLSHRVLAFPSVAAAVGALGERPEPVLVLPAAVARTNEGVWLRAAFYAAYGPRADACEWMLAEDRFLSVVTAEASPPSALPDAKAA